MQLLLRKKAAEELKKEQERKAAERRRIIEERCGQPRDLEDANEGKLLFRFCYPGQNHVLKQVRQKRRTIVICVNVMTGSSICAPRLPTCDPLIHQ